MTKINRIFIKKLQKVRNRQKEEISCMSFGTASPSSATTMLNKLNFEWQWEVLPSWVSTIVHGQVENVLHRTSNIWFANSFYNYPPFSARWEKGLCCCNEDNQMRYCFIYKIHSDMTWLCFACGLLPALDWVSDFIAISRCSVVSFNVL